MSTAKSICDLSREFVRSGRGGAVYHSAYRGVCPTCRRLCDGTREIRGDRVLGRVRCPEHGESEALLSGDADWFLKSLTCVKRGSIPLAHSTAVEKGCPEDCGLCPDHGQHSCLPIIEITNHCNMDCPICLVDNRGNYMMSEAEFGGIIDGLVEKEGTPDTINISGGEPTLHPRFLALLDLAHRREISRVSISTNGLVLARDRELCRELAERGVYVSLQLDSGDDSGSKELRGQKGLLEIKKRALENMEACGGRVTLVATAARGLNDGCLGQALELLMTRESVLSMMVQPAAIMRPHPDVPFDPMERLTIPDVVALLADQSGGALRRSDFVPLPCSHPSCFALTYLLVIGDGEIVPFPRFVKIERYLELLANRGAMRPDEAMENTMRETIDDLWSGAHQLPDSERILRALKDALARLYPEGRALEIRDRLELGEAAVKTVFIHSFMDPHTFDLERLRKCCTHYALPDGRLMPGCAYNLFYRESDLRFAADGSGS